MFESKSSDWSCFLSDSRTRLVALLVSKKWIPQRLLMKDQTFDASNSTNVTNESNISLNSNVTQSTLTKSSDTLISNENLNSADNILQQLDNSLHTFQKLVETQGNLSTSSSFDNLTLENEQMRDTDV
jgi:hypothetical protein